MDATGKKTVAEELAASVDFLRRLAAAFRKSAAVDKRTSRAQRARAIELAAEHIEGAVDQVTAGLEALRGVL